jgi:hypothetical protein
MISNGSPLGSVVGWLRAGYPQGVPQHDYLPLFALLRRRLSDDEVRDVATSLAGVADPATAAGIAFAISEVTHESAREEDIARVSARLAAGGWPLADLHDGTAG